MLFTISPAIQLPAGLGEGLGLYKHIGKIYANAGNGVALPRYGVTRVDATYNLSDNIFNVIRLTEGNPRQARRRRSPMGTSTSGVS